MRYLSVFDSDSDILKAMSDIFLKGSWYDLDCTYSKGVFYKNIPQPRFKSDLIPLYDDVVECDSTKLDKFEDKSMGSVVFDPPFLFRNRKSKNNDKMSARFSYFSSYEELMVMYEESIKAINRVLKNKGFLFFKCQDMTDGKFYCTHVEIIKMAEKNGFELRDIVVKVSKSKLQRDAKQQNCVAKVHSYWLVFRKQKNIDEWGEDLC